MDWKDIASVDLPALAQTGDLVGVVAQLRQQVKAALAPKASDSDIPHVKALAPVVEDAFEALVDAHEALRAAELQRTPAVEPTAGPRDTVTTNANSDESWRAFEKMLDGGRLLNDNVVPGRAEAEALYLRLFSTHGLRFINYRPRRQWEVADTLVTILREPAVVATVEAVGGTRHLKGVFAFHKDFGAAHGFSKATPLGVTPVTSTRDQQLALQAALRDYLIKVSSQVSPKRPETALLAKFLLLPYTEMVDDLAGSATPRAVTPAPAPEPKPLPA